MCGFLGAVRRYPPCCRIRTGRRRGPVPAHDRGERPTVRRSAGVGQGAYRSEPTAARPRYGPVGQRDRGPVGVTGDRPAAGVPARDPPRAVASAAALCVVRAGNREADSCAVRSGWLWGRTGNPGPRVVQRPRRRDGDRGWADFCRTPIAAGSVSAVRSPAPRRHRTHPARPRPRRRPRGALAAPCPAHRPPVPGVSAPPVGRRLRRWDAPGWKSHRCSELGVWWVGE